MRSLPSCFGGNRGIRRVGLRGWELSGAKAELRSDARASAAPSQSAFPRFIRIILIISRVFQHVNRRFGAGRRNERGENKEGREGFAVVLFAGKEEKKIQAAPPGVV